MKLTVSMTHRETLMGWVFLVISQTALPGMINWINTQLNQPLSEPILNIFFFFVSFLSVVVIFHKFLKRSLQVAIGNPWRCLRFAALGYVIYRISTILLNLLIIRVCPEFANVNDAAVLDLFHDHRVLMTLAVIILVPIIEETLYRGLLFGTLCRRNRLLAYLVSTLVFSMIHVVGYLGQHTFRVLFLCFLQYLPAGIILAWSYEKADTIIAPILIHATVNQIGISAMR